MTDDARFDERLRAFAARAKRVAPACDNETQTRTSLINPYLECLGYDVRDPLVCRLEYAADIGKAGEKVDYAIMRGGRPSILIEAKAAKANLSNETVPTQLQRYFMAVNADFAAFTNGLVWQWYRSSGNDRELDKAPFLVHDVRTPPDRQELRWLASVCGPDFDPNNARTQAEEASIASAVLTWIEQMRHNPSDDLLRVIIKSMGLGLAHTNRIERARRTFVETFRTYLDREADSLLSAAKEQLNEEVRPSEAPSETDSGGEHEIRVVDLGDGQPPLSSAKWERAWRAQGSAWHRESDGAALMMAVIRYLASIDARGRQRYYDEAMEVWGAPLFFRHEESQGKRGRWVQVEPGIDRWVNTGRSNKSKERFLARACAAVQMPSGESAKLGETVEVMLEI